MDGYDRLSNAIIELACQDLVEASKILKLSEKGYKKYKKETIERAEKIVNDVIRFLNSTWITKLSPNLDIDNLTELLGERIDKEVNDYIKTHKPKRKNYNHCMRNK